MESRPSTHRHALEALGKTDVDDADDDLDLVRKAGPSARMNSCIIDTQRH